MTEKMKEVLLYCLAEEYELAPEDYSKRTIRALEKKGFIDGDEYEITEKGIRSLGLPATIRVKKAKTIIKKIVSILSEYDVEVLSSKEIPLMAAEEVIQVGPLVLARGARKPTALEMDKYFTITTAKDTKRKFKKGGNYCWRSPTSQTASIKRGMH